MPDVFDNFDSASPETQAILIAFLEQRNAAPARREILDSYLAEIVFPRDARVLEVGCGSGGITRVLAQWPGVGEAVGIEPWAAFITKVRELGAGIANLSFQQADGHALPFDDGSFDAVIFHTALLHMRDPALALAEAHRVLRVGGWVSIFDPDPLAITYAITEHDPLQAVLAASIPMAYLHPWLPRQLPGRIRAAGFSLIRIRSFGTVETDDEAGGVIMIKGSADGLARNGVIGAELAEAMKRETDRRIEAGTFVHFGTLVSVIGRKEA
jgi:arsenite methyltransferase